MTFIFKNRTQVGQMLAKKLSAYANQADTIAIPCGIASLTALVRAGVPVTYEIATALNIPLDIVTVKKLSVLGNSELAMGALAKLPGTGYYR